MRGQAHGRRDCLLTVKRCGAVHSATLRRLCSARLPVRPVRTRARERWAAETRVWEGRERML